MNKSLHLLSDHNLMSHKIHVINIKKYKKIIHCNVINIDLDLLQNYKLRLDWDVGILFMGI